MRKVLVAFSGLCLLCLTSGCGGGSNKVERPAHPVPVQKDAKLSSATAGKAAPATKAPPASPGQPSK
jgi:hypothetical protein